MRRVAGVRREACEAAKNEGETSEETPAALDDNEGAQTSEETPAEAETSEETNED